MCIIIVFLSSASYINLLKLKALKLVLNHVRFFNERAVICIFSACGKCAMLDLVKN